VTGFDEATHTYSINGRVVPSVTQVIGDLLPYRGPVAGNAWYMQRGSAVHAYAAMIGMGQAFEISQPDPEVQAYMEGCVASIQAFFAEVKPRILAVEKRLFSERHQFGGTLDLLAHIGAEKQPCVLDWKPHIPTSLPYQLGGYGILCGTADARWGRGVEYSPDGKYRLSERYDLRRYGAGFLALLGAYNVRKECGVE
jgi:hypothetical protein